MSLVTRRYSSSSDDDEACSPVINNDYTPEGRRSRKVESRHGEKERRNCNKVSLREEWNGGKMEKSNAAKDKGYKRSAAIGGAMDAVGAGCRLIPTGDWNKDHQRNAQANVAKGEAEAKLWDHGGAAADATYCGAAASTYCNGISGGANADAKWAEATAKASLVDGVIEANADASAYKAQAGANYSPLGATAEASAHVAKAQAGIANTPFNVSASMAEAGAKTGVSLQYVGAEIGASLAEASAGPFAVRAGVKFGAKIENGIPSVDLGPVSAPCSIM